MDDRPGRESPTSGAMVIRVEAANGFPHGFHARLTIMTQDGEQETSDLAEVDRVIESVRQWLHTFTPTPPGAPDEPADGGG